MDLTPRSVVLTFPTSPRGKVSIELAPTPLADPMADPLERLEHDIAHLEVLLHDLCASPDVIEAADPRDIEGAHNQLAVLRACLTTLRQHYAAPVQPRFVGKALSCP